MIHPKRITFLNNQPVRKGAYVVYWMQQAQRTQNNHALTYAILEANRLGVPLLVFFALTDSFPDANLRHYHFMLKGLSETKATLFQQGINMVLVRGEPPEKLGTFAKKALLVVTDCGYLRIQKYWRQKSATTLKCPLIQVETDVVVPVSEVSSKEEYAAATIRSKLHKRSDEFLTDIETPQVKKDSLQYTFKSIDLSDTDRLCMELSIDHTVPPVRWIRPGEQAAGELLDSFIATKLDHFRDLRNDPSVDYLSHMSPYLHFGQISPQKIIQKVLASWSKSSESYLEELFIRRELSMNFVNYNPSYDSFACLPAWCKKTLLEHKGDKREYLYTKRQFERGETHDPYWNAAQMEMVKKGKMHGYMRMYWGKKIIEWSNTPEKAFSLTLWLNNKYSLDGRDPNGYTGVAWCFGKHDRAWGERNIFGKIRFMNDKGLRRKFNIDQYVRNVETFTEN